jgi:hypothetical protein
MWIARESRKRKNPESSMSFHTVGKSWMRRVFLSSGLSYQRDIST